MKEEFSVGVVVVTESTPRKYLILHYASGHWEFPRGKIEEGESYLETASRECEEETGITQLNYVDSFEVMTKWNYHRGGDDIQKQATYLLATTSQTEITISDEHQGYEWLEFDAAVERTTFENAKGMLRKAEELLEKK